MQTYTQALNYKEQHKTNINQRVKNVEFSISSNTITKCDENQFARYVDSLFQRGIVTTKGLADGQHKKSGSSILNGINAEGEKVHNKVYYYQHHLAPFYEQARAKKNGFKMSAVIRKYIELNQQHDYAFVTPTMPNITMTGRTPEETANLIKKLNQRAKKVQRDMVSALNRKYPYADISYISKSEMTYNTGTGFNPHAHLLLAYDRRHLTSGELKRDIFEYWYKNFLAKEEVKGTWTKRDKEEYRKAYYGGAFQPVKNVNELINEMSKYMAKSNDYLKHGQNVFDVFYLSTKGTKRLLFNGAFQVLAKQYELGNLLVCEEEQAEEEQEQQEVVYNQYLKWNKEFKSYQIDYIENIKSNATMFIDYKQVNEPISPDNVSMLDIIDKNPNTKFRATMLFYVCPITGDIVTRLG